MKKEKWPSVELGEVCVRLTDGSHFSPTAIAQGFPYITVKDISEDGKIDLKNSKRISQIDYENLVRNGCKPNRGDVLFSKDGTVGKVALVDSEDDFVVLSSIAILTIRDTLALPKYIYYTLTSSLVLQNALGLMKGIAIRRIILRDLKKISIPLPPLSIQRQIISILDAASDLKKKRAEADKKMAEFAPALFHQMFGDPGRNEKGWEVKKLGEVVELINGRAFKPSEWSEHGLPIIRIQNLNDASKPYNYFVGDLPEKYHIRSGDILFSWSGTPGTSFGCFKWKGVDGWLNQHIFKINFKTEVADEYFVYWLNSQLELLIGMAHGGVGLRHVTKGTVDQLAMLLPPLELQRQFASRIAEVRNTQERQNECGRKLEWVFDGVMAELL